MGNKWGEVPMGLVITLSLIVKIAFPTVGIWGIGLPIEIFPKAWFYFPTSLIPHSGN